MEYDNFSHLLPWLVVEHVEEHSPVLRSEIDSCCSDRCHHRGIVEGLCSVVFDYGWQLGGPRPVRILCSDGQHELLKAKACHVLQKILAFSLQTDSSNYFTVLLFFLFSLIQYAVHCQGTLKNNS